MQGLKRLSQGVKLLIQALARLIVQSDNFLKRNNGVKRAI
jgi:hypothetical protein